MKRILCLFLCFCLFFLSSCRENNEDSTDSSNSSAQEELAEDNRNLTAQENGILSVSGKDALNRSFEASDGYDQTKYVGMFYFLWNGAHTTNKYDVNWLLENAPEDLWATTAETSLYNTYHYWGEPLFGYYHNEDEWIVNRHIEMLTYAGIDFIGMDVTNGYTYDGALKVVMDTLLKYKKQGFKVPKVTFLTNTNSINTIVNLYNKWYSVEEYSDLWFAPNGKPMIAGSKYGWPDEYESVKAAFDLKPVDWPDKVQSPDGFAWMDFNYPQRLHKLSGQMSVSVAQHNSVRMSNTYNGNRGRSFDPNTVEHNPSRVNYGDNYAAQWETVLSTEGVKITFVTGWNEWIAIKFVDSSNQVYFVDQFNTDFSRDIEPMKDGFGDNYYMQTVDNVKRWKGSEQVKYKYKNASEAYFTDGTAWDNVVGYADFAGDAINRDFQGSIPGVYYTDNSARNDVVNVKVASDTVNMYFRIETLENVTLPQGSNWMNLLVNVRSNESKGFENFNYVINKSVDLSKGKTEVSKFTGSGYETVSAAEGDIRVDGRYVYIKVKLSDLGLSADDRYISFKVSDNVSDQADIMNYYISGDSAPIGRLAYSYGYR